MEADGGRGNGGEQGVKVSVDGGADEEMALTQDGTAEQKYEMGPMEQLDDDKSVEVASMKISEECACPGALGEDAEKVRGLPEPEMEVGDGLGGEAVQGIKVSNHTGSLEELDETGNAGGPLGMEVTEPKIQLMNVLDVCGVLGEPEEAGNVGGSAGMEVPLSQEPGHDAIQTMKDSDECGVLRESEEADKVGGEAKVEDKEEAVVETKLQDIAEGEVSRGRGRPPKGFPKLPSKKGRKDSDYTKKRVPKAKPKGAGGKSQNQESDGKKEGNTHKVPAKEHITRSKVKETSPPQEGPAEEEPAPLEIDAAADLGFKARIDAHIDTDVRGYTHT